MVIYVIVVGRVCFCWFYVVYVFVGCWNLRGVFGFVIVYVVFFIVCIM